VVNNIGGQKSVSLLGIGSCFAEREENDGLGWTHRLINRQANRNASWVKESPFALLRVAPCFGEGSPAGPPAVSAGFQAYVVGLCQDVPGASGVGITKKACPTRRVRQAGLKQNTWFRTASRSTAIPSRHVRPEPDGSSRWKSLGLLPASGRQPFEQAGWGVGLPGHED